MSLRHPRCHVLGQPPCCPFASHSAQSGGILRPVDSHGAHGCGGHVLGSLCHQVLCVRSPLWIRIRRPLWRDASCHTLPLRCYQRYPHNRFPQVRTANSELNEIWLWLLATFVRAAELAYGHAGFSQTRRSKAENVLMMVDAFASPFRSKVACRYWETPLGVRQAITAGGNREVHVAPYHRFLLQFLPAKTRSLCYPDSAARRALRLGRSFLAALAAVFLLDASSL